MSVLSDMRELASAWSLDTFTHFYQNILRHHPDCPPEVVKKLIRRREGIPWKDVTEIIEACQEIYEKSLIDGKPSKSGFVFFPKVKCLKVSQGGLGHKLSGGGYADSHVEGLTRIYKFVMNGFKSDGVVVKWSSTLMILGLNSDI